MSAKRNGRMSSRSWDPVAAWYAGWVGAEGSRHHRQVAIPAVLELLCCGRGEKVLDLGCGPGVLAPHVVRAGGTYTGVDSSRRLIDYAREHHGRHARFVLADVTGGKLLRTADLARGRGADGFDAVVFLLSIQDIEPLEGALANAAAALRPGGRVVMLMTHPCFRVPRQSGWGWDEKRRLQFRRVDRYLSPLSVPMKQYAAGRPGATRSHHRPLEHYVAGLAAHGLVIDSLREIPGLRPDRETQPRAVRLAEQEIPLFLSLRAVKR